MNHHAFAPRLWLVPAAALALLASSAAAVSTTGCTSLYGLSQCSTGTQEQLASPSSGSTGVSPGIGSITLVASSNSNQLYSTFAQWQITLTDNFGNVVTGGSLSLVPCPSCIHPYQSDFYYASSMPQLNAGRTYTAYLNRIGALCPPIPLGSFST